MTHKHPGSKRVCVRRAKQDRPRRRRPEPSLSLHRRWEKPSLSVLEEEDEIVVI